MLLQGWSHLQLLGDLTDPEEILFSPLIWSKHPMGLPRWCSGKQSACQCKRCKRLGLIPGLGRSPGEGNGNPLQYSCLGSPMDRGAWCATVHGVIKSFKTVSIYLFLVVLGPCCFAQAFSSCGEWGYSSLWRTGFLLWRLLLLRSTGPVAVAHRLSCSMACRIFPDQGSNSCTLH